MKTTLFELPAHIPAIEKTIPIYRTINPILSETNPEKTFEKRLKKLAAAFRLAGKPQDLGDRVSIQKGAQRLDLYKASDAFWYADRDLACIEKPQSNHRQMDIRAARKTATILLEEQGLLLPEMRFTDTGHTIVSSCDGKGENENSELTETKVRFGFFLGDKPVFGPGAKAAVGLTDENTVSQVMHFWRRVEKVAQRRVIAPEVALRVLTQNFRFRQLRPGEAKVRLHSIELGCYALPAFVLQRHLIPVWQVKGTVVTELLPRYDFTLHVTAVRVRPEDIRREGLHTPPVPVIVF